MRNQRAGRGSRGVSRRHFVASTAGAAIAGALGARSLFAETPDPSIDPSIDPSVPVGRAAEAYGVRVAAADLARKQPSNGHRGNGDETRYATRWASYTKALPHDALGHVVPDAYAAYLAAMRSGDAEQMEKIPLGGFTKLSNPHAALAFDLIGPDAAQPSLAPPPRMDSAERAAELVELYWHSLLRDVRFADYESTPLVKRACDELTSLRTFTGPRVDGKVIPATLFRGQTRGGRIGPYVSQFLLRDIPFGAMRVPQKYRIAAPSRDYLTEFEEWRAMQNGGLAPSTAFADGTSHIVAARNLTEYVHRDFTYQAFLGAALMLLKISAPLDGGIPYQYSINQGGFVTFGAPDVLHYVSAAANSSLKPAWFQKWMVHRTARPEEIAARVHCHLAKKAEYPLHESVLRSEAVAETRRRFGSALLSQAYPEGCPTHPSFPAGHAVIAGACATVLKAWFNESWTLPSCSLPKTDGSGLVPYSGPDLTVGGELDKLAENIAISRNFAGVHWRSDGQGGLELGERFAIQFLCEMKLCSRETFQGFSLTKFDGSTITV
jgi:membrane-associated phospholipid phosphatase